MKNFIITLSICLGALLTSPLSAVEINSSTIYEIVADPCESILIQEHLAHWEVAKIAKEVPMVFIDGSHYSRWEVRSLLKQQPNIIVILQPQTLNHREIETLAPQDLRRRVLLSPKNFQEWEVTKLAREGYLVYIDGDRYQPRFLERLRDAGVHLIVSDTAFQGEDFHAITHTRKEQVIIILSKEDTLYAQKLTEMGLYYMPEKRFPKPSVEGKERFEPFCITRPTNRYRLPHSEFQ